MSPHLLLILLMQALGTTLREYIYFILKTLVIDDTLTHICIFGNLILSKKYLLNEPKFVFF